MPPSAPLRSSDEPSGERRSGPHAGTDDAALSDLRAELTHVLTDTLALLQEVSEAVSELPAAERDAAARLQHSTARLHALQNTLRNTASVASPVRTVRGLIDAARRLATAAGVELRLALDDGALRAPLDGLGDSTLDLVRALLESASPDDIIELGACIVNQRRLNLHIAASDNGEPVCQTAIDALAMEAAVRGGRVDVVQAPFGPQRIFRITAPLPLGMSAP